jgi:CubicO group peptidase (beta-lactamase class C family)
MNYLLFTLLLINFISPYLNAAHQEGFSYSYNRNPQMGTAPPTPASPPPDSFLEKIRAKHNVPALATAIVKSDTITIEVSGVRKLGDSTPITSADKFHLGSCTKAMTATVLAVFIERGALRWAATLQEIFPEWVHIHPHFKNVTIEMLTSNRAGID